MVGPVMFVNGVSAQSSAPLTVNAMVETTIQTRFDFDFAEKRTELEAESKSKQRVQVHKSFRTEPSPVNSISIESRSTLRLYINQSDLSDSA